MDRKELIDAAKAARELAYAPYSGFKVGAALLTESGRLFTGCNVESASLGLSMCAERVAIFKAVSEGEEHLESIAIVCSDPEKCTPCGACRQLISEFGPDADVITENKEGGIDVTNIRDILPDYFTM